MIIKEILMLLETATQPVAKVLKKGENFKVMAIGFKKGMKLKEHKSPLAANLTVLYGKIIYKERLHEKLLTVYENTEIAVDEIYSLEALEDSLCLLIQG